VGLYPRSRARPMDGSGKRTDRGIRVPRRPILLARPAPERRFSGRAMLLGRAGGFRSYAQFLVLNHQRGRLRSIQIYAIVNLAVVTKDRFKYHADIISIHEEKNCYR
jgi:hypothetical protein